MSTTAAIGEITRVRWSSQDPADVFSVDDPSTGELLARVHGAGVDEVEAAVRAAHEGFRVWSRRPARERGKYLREIAQLIREHADELAELECREVGKPFTQARRFDVEFCIAVFEFFAGMSEDLPSSSRRSGPLYDVTSLVPYGVVAGIIPFNWPPIHTAGKMAPALAVGNAIVLKPGDQAPLTIMRIVELAQQVLPDDVVHVLPGGGKVGASLVANPLVRKISFTGAPATGAAVIKASADNLTPVLMELGGKNPVVIFDDADLDLAITGAVEGGFFNQGEACTAGSRVLVHRPVYEAVVARLGAAISRLRVGPGMDAQTHIGPMVTAAQQARVLEYIELGQAEGARLVAQAPLPDAPELASGFWVPPTLFADATPQMRISQEEIFGPVAVVIPFDTEEEAVEIANGTEFALVASVWGRDTERAVRVGNQIEGGIIFVNNFHRSFLGVPFGGTKKSGFGREHSAQTLHEFGYSKTLRIPSGDGKVPQWDGAVAATSG